MSSSPLRDMFADPSTMWLISTAVLTAAYSSYRANDALLKTRRPSHRQSIPTLSDQLMDDNSHMLQGPAAMMFPVIAAISITLLFFFLRSVGIIFTALSTISGFFAVVFVVWPFAEALAARVLPLSITSNRDNLTTAVTACAVPIALAVILTWLITGNWLCNNAIGISLCIFFASLCKVSNLKVTTILFTGLFFYDIFFVFFSEHFFGRNVMIEVATTEPTNPASAIASWFNLPLSPVKTLALPAKLIIPTANGNYAILGLGDIILPEILLAFLLQFDLLISITPIYTGYFVPALIAYAFALGLSFYCNYAFLSAQPALLYIVPAVLMTTTIAALSRRHFSTMWNGPSPSGPSHPRYGRDREEEDADDYDELVDDIADTRMTHKSESHLLLESKSKSKSTLAQQV